MSSTRYNTLTGTFDEVEEPFYIIMPGCGCRRKTFISPDSPMGAAYWAYVKARGCPTCRRAKHRVPFWA